MASLETSEFTFSTPTYAGMLNETRGSRYVLQYDPVTHKLKVWKWPIILKDGVDTVVPPSELRELSQTHKFRAPLCLCPLLDESLRNASVESAIFVRTRQLQDDHRVPGVGEYVAMCATERCGYFVYLERIFMRREQAFVALDELNEFDVRPPLVFHRSELSLADMVKYPDILQRQDHGVKRRFDDIDDLESALRHHAPTTIPRPRHVRYKERWDKLVDNKRPGLSVKEFEALWLCCSRCRTVTKISDFHAHSCRSMALRGIEAGDDA